MNQPTKHDEPLLPEDLSVIERHGGLSAAQQRRLQMALAASPSLRCSHQLGQDFDALETNGANDAELIDAVAAASRHRFGGVPLLASRSRQRRLLPWMFVAGMMLVSAAAGATLWPYARSFVASISEDESTSTSIPPARTPLAANQTDQMSQAERRDIVAPPHPVAAGVPSASPPQELARTPDVAASPDRTKPAPGTDGTLSTQASRLPTSAPEPPKSAADLFGEANRARRNNDIEGALRLYQLLSRAYPEAKETVLSYAIAGRIALRRNAFAEARVEFDRYLRLAPNGALAEESLEGKATAFRRLGQFEQEAEALRELLNRFPASVYGTTARERLDELQ